MSGNGNGSNNGTNNNGGNGNGGSAGSGPSLEQTLATTKGLLEANLEAGVPAPEALENSRPRNWNS
ncbi:hypothetical protein BKA00_004824 [Actinomadura coerulea]|uniref:Uncharacterized protein n=1 Tax=Actinomadura coerulea TaxID=46159 RepID=A0A7X0G1X5_9ACTN|nr:hypothetical protein [Actinomadura coerulea]MBB6397910.1 hypothetical protein [Actinomadura coerulea]GGQ19484.1 hypothetical protein GCM10010187_39830 [Actinomadura coerulea]